MLVLYFVKLAFGQLSFVMQDVSLSVYLSGHPLGIYCFVLPPHASLVILCLSGLFEAGLRPASFLITHVFLSVYLSVPPLVISCLSYHLILHLSPHASLVILCLSCLFEAGLRPVSFYNTRVSVCVLVCASSFHLLLVLPPHPSLIISCSSCHLMLALSF